MTDNLCINTRGIVEEEGKFLGEVCSVLQSIGGNLNNFVKDYSMDASVTEPECDITAAELVSRTLTLKNDVASLLGSPTVFDKERAAKLDEVQKQYDELYKGLLEQQDQLGRAQDEIISLRNQVMHQSTFCASLGAVLGNLVWQASRSTQVVDMWLSRFQTKIGEFLCIVNGTFVSFINTYASVFPCESSDEYLFVMGLCGIVTNISASPEGRQFLVRHPNGKDLLQKIVKLMPLVPLLTGQSLARLILMILYNISINQAGLQYLMELRVCRVLHQYMDESVSIELKQLSLRLLQSITFELQDETTIDDILTTVKLERIQELSQSKSKIVAVTAKEVLSNLNKWQPFLKKTGRDCSRTDPNNQKYEADNQIIQRSYTQSNRSAKTCDLNNE